MKKKKLLLPIMMSALCFGAGVAGVAAFSNANAEAPGIVATVDADATTETATRTYQVHRLNAASSESTSSETSEETSTSVSSTTSESANEVAAKAVDTLISAIGDVTTESREDIKDAKEAYEDLTYEQQKLVKHADDLEDAIKEYNKLIKDNDDIKPIESLKHKSFISEAMEENKGLKTALIVFGTITGLGLFHLVFLGIKKIIKFFKC